MENVTLSAFASWVVIVAGSIVTISQAWKVISKYLHPEADVRKEVSTIRNMLDNDDRRLKELEKDSKRNDEFQSVVSRVLFAQLNHELSGNGDELLRSARDLLQKYLAERI